MHRTLSDAFHKLLNHAEGGPLTFRTLLSILGENGYPVIILLISTPFILPIQIPGFSTPFGLVLIFLGFGMFFNKEIWCPDALGRKELSYATLEKIVKQTDRLILWIKPLFHPRLQFLSQHPLIWKLNGAVVILLAILLSLPLPIPFTNMLCALPLIVLSLAILEDDGLANLVAFFLTLICLSYFFLILWFGEKLISSMI